MAFKFGELLADSSHRGSTAPSGSNCLHSSMNFGSRS